MCDIKNWKTFETIKKDMQINDTQKQFFRTEMRVLYVVQLQTLQNNSHSHMVCVIDSRMEYNNNILNPTWIAN